MFLHYKTINEMIDELGREKAVKVMQSLDTLLIDIFASHIYREYAERGAGAYFYKSDVPDSAEAEELIDKVKKLIEKQSIKYTKKRI